MAETTTYSDVAWMTPRTFYGLVNHGAESVLAATYEHPWQRDQALLAVIDGVLRSFPSASPAEDSVKPRWLDGLVERELRAAATNFWSRGAFARVRVLERIGVVRPAVDEIYVLAMISSLGPDKVRRLKADPDLIAGALWLVFEVEGGGEVSLTNVDRFGGEEWRKTFLEFAADGTIERSRLLSECLKALGRDFAAYRASWFSATYLALEPTPTETAADQADVRRLLGSSVPATVGFALKQLLRVHKAGLLDPKETLAALSPATLAKASGTALNALRLAATLKNEDPIAAAKVAQSGLTHPATPVQRAAVALLASLGDTTAVLDAARDLTPSIRREIGLDAAVVQSTEARVEQRLIPTARPVSAADLAERTASLMEDPSDVAELEAVLAAFVTHDVDELLRPLRQRAKAIVARGSATDFGDAWLPGELGRLVLDVLGDPLPTARAALPAQRFVQRRFEEIRQSRTLLLATPDMPGGWISAQTLVERLSQTPTPRHHDLTAALLRLHPDDRAGLGRGAHLPPAVIFALNGVDGATGWRTRKGPVAWWTAAERSRAPYIAAELPNLRGDMKIHTWQENGRELRFPYVKFTVTARIARSSADDRPTELLVPAYPTPQGWGLNRPLGGWIPLVASIWPRDSEHFLALTCGPVLESPRSSEIRHDIPLIIDALAKHPGRMGPLAANTLAAGLSATHRVHRMHAVDAFMDLVAPGRISPIELVGPMANFAEAWPATRWVESLGTIASAPGGSQPVNELLTQLLPKLRRDHRGLSGLLQLFRDETLRRGWRISDPTLIRWLSELTGSSAAAMLARDLLR